MPRFLALDWDAGHVHLLAATVAKGGLRLEQVLAWPEEQPPAAANAEAFGQRLRERLREAGVSPAPLLVSSSSTGGTTAGNGASTFPLLSGSGTVGTFVSAATDLLSAATTGTQTFLFAANLPPRPLVVSGLTNGSAKP